QQLGGRADLALEPIEPVGAAQHLERQPPAVAMIDGLVHLAEAAFADEAHQLEALRPAEVAGQTDERRRGDRAQERVVAGVARMHLPDGILAYFARPIASFLVWANTRVTSRMRRPQPRKPSIATA